MVLGKFKERKINKNITMLMATILVVGALLIGISFAVYQEESEVALINASVRYPYANEVTYTTTSNSKVTNVEEALNDLYERFGK